MNLAPIVLFVYKRPDHTKKVLDALADNAEAIHSDLYICIDGPKDNKTDIDLVNQVQNICKSEKRFNRVILKINKKNKGLANSIIDGVTEVINLHGKVIVLEDDIVVSKGFLDFMNTGLLKYKDEERIMHISGYMYPYKGQLPETFFFNVPLCWGWATWKRAWDKLEVNPIKHWQYLDNNKLWDNFNKFGGTYLQDQLAQNITGKLYTWFVKWHATVFSFNGFVLYPNKSFVQNIGFDGTGVNNGESSLFFHANLQTKTAINDIEFIECVDALNYIQAFYKTVNERKIKLSPRLLMKVWDKNFYKQKIVNLANFLVRVLDVSRRSSVVRDSYLGQDVNLYYPYRITNSRIGNYTYIAENSKISMANIGKYSSIGPNFMCGYGVHPIDGFSTSPLIYSNRKIKDPKSDEYITVMERKEINIGHDVFIGMNVTVLDGITIGDGAVIGAGSVVSKDIPEFAIAFGSPIQIVGYRFNQETIQKLKAIEWWNMPIHEILDNPHFFDIDSAVLYFKNKNK